MKIKFEPRDLWIGVFWDIKFAGYPAHRLLYVYVCIVPMFPILFVVDLGAK